MYAFTGDNGIDNGNDIGNDIGNENKKPPPPFHKLCIKKNCPFIDGQCECINVKKIKKKGLTQ